MKQIERQTDITIERET